jgi:flagellar basal-body rod protein FlgB
MKMKLLTCDRLLGRTASILSRVLDFRSANHSVISGNLANIDTPGFKPTELSFDEALRQAVERDILPLRTTERGHFSHFVGNGFPARDSFDLEDKAFTSIEGDYLDIDREMATLAENNILYEANTRLLAKKFQALRAAIEEGRR